MPPKHAIDHGSLMSPESQPERIEPGPAKLVAISGVLHNFVELRGVDPESVNERDISKLTPDYIETGLYVPRALADSDRPQARGHVIFPAAEYKLLTASPERLAEAAATGVRNRRSHAPDKARTEIIAGRASAHALESQNTRASKLIDALQLRQDELKILRDEIMGARGTGWFAHYPADKVKMIIINGETAIMEALDVCAITKKWDAEQLARAKSTMDYKLFGDHPDRFKNWKAFSHMAYTYTRKRKLVVMAERQRLERVYKKYEHYLNEE